MELNQAALRVHSLLPRMMPYLSDAVLALPSQHNTVITIPDPIPRFTLRDCLNENVACQTEQRCAVYFGKVVERCHDGLPYDRDIMAFAHALNRLVADGVLKYGHLAPPLCIPLVDIPDQRPPSCMLLFYSYSDFSRKELNARYKAKVFVEEGDLPDDWSWDTIASSDPDQAIKGTALGSL
jgi:hypothetical protein